MKKRVLNLMERLEAVERDFLGQQFLAPAVSGGMVHVRIAGVLLRLRPQPADFAGWGIFEPTSYDSAQLICEAGLAQKQAYLRLLQPLRLILLNRDERSWQAIAATAGDARLTQGQVSVQLVDGADRFDQIRARFDGANFWYERIDPSADAAAAAYLRKSIRQLLAPEKLSRSGLTASQRAAYASVFSSLRETREKTHRDQVEARLHQALGHAGAELLGYTEHKDGYRVKYRVDGQEHVSSVTKRDLQVQVAGICLSGQDHRFDLNSLVGVLQQAEARHALRVGDRRRGGIAEADYWQIHPPDDE